MGGFELVKKFSDRPDLSFRLLQALADAFPWISLGGDIEQTLVGLGVLHNGCRLPLHRKHDRSFAFLQLLHKVALLVPQPLNRIQLRRFSCRVVAEEDSYSS